MTLQEFQDLLKVIQTTQAESRTIEVKRAASGSPKRIYDTISSFSNQDDGGVIVFGLDENAGFAEVGVKDAQELQKQISHQALEMEPVVRPLISIFHHNGKDFVTAEIPGIPVPDCIGAPETRGNRTNLTSSHRPRGWGKGQISLDLSPKSFG